MINYIAYETLGQADHGWLKAKHHFSFANYYNADRMGFGVLRVINDDWVAPGRGFPPHPHENMEIITFVRTGAITHQDSSGNHGITNSGEVQVMSAGSGIVHSEYNKTDTPLTLYQIWIETNRQNAEPRWESRLFPTKPTSTTLPLLVSGYPEDNQSALFINQLARIYGGIIKKGAKVDHKINHLAYVLASKGAFEISDDTGKTVTLNKGDGAEVSEIKSMTLNALSDCEIVIIDVPQRS